MNFTRRQLFISAGLAGAGLGVGKFLLDRENERQIYGENKKSHKIVIGHQHLKNTFDKNSYLASVEIDSGLNYRIPTKCYPHGILLHPKNENTVICFPKFGLVANEVNLQENKSIKDINCIENREFYGHGVFSKNGDTVMSTEVNTKTGEGLLVVRDGVSYKEMGQIKTYGIGPHDCRLLPDGKTVIIANSGNYILPPIANQVEPRSVRVIENSCLSWVDLSSGKLLDKKEIPSPMLSVGHFEVSGQYVVAITLPQPNSKIPNIESHALRKNDCVFISDSGAMSLG